VQPVHRGPQAAARPGEARSHAPNAALLIDFDNVTMGIQKDLHAELKSLLSSDIIQGKVSVQRAYADWRRYPQYIVPLSESSIDLIFAPAYGSSKKNATDIRLAVDAIEIVFTRPEIGTFILLSGDSDFSSLVLKLKEYGKYVIGVGIRESSSDLLVQNCDEYYSYNALAGLVKTSDDEVVKHDPWELVGEAMKRMVRNGDVMRSDRLKQVMQEIDPNFDEKNLGMSKFSRFTLEASQRGLITVRKLDNGQLEVGPAGPAVPAAAEAPREERPERGDDERRGRRGRRGRGRGRDRERDERGGEAVGAPSAPARPVIGAGGERLTKDEAFALVRRAVDAVAPPEATIGSERVREQAFALLGRDSESLAERNFLRILRDAHDAGQVALSQQGDTYAVGRAVAGAAVTAQLNIAERAAAPGAPAAPPPPTRGVGAGRVLRGGRGKALPPDLLLVGVVDHEEPAPAPTPVPDAEPPKKARARAKKSEGAAPAAKKAAPKAKAAKPRAKRAKAGAAAE
jgi:uncharacterized protein (TIGR00288 family)